MKTLILAGIVSVVLALSCYTVAFVIEQRQRRVDGKVLGLLVPGVLFDLGSAVFMILGATRPLPTLHGLAGFTALGLMLIVTALAIRLRGAPVTASFHALFQIVYALWVVAFLSGLAMVAGQRAAARHAALLSS